VPSLEVTLWCDTTSSFPTVLDEPDGLALPMSMMPQTKALTAACLSIEPDEWRVRRVENRLLAQALSRFVFEQPYSTRAGELPIPTSRHFGEYADFRLLDT
jgi:hypothetical protein